MLGAGKRWFSMNKNERFTHEDLEQRLGTLCSIEPSPALRARILRNAEQEACTYRRTTIIFRVAVCALLVTLGWAHWKEDDTAERMARAAGMGTEQSDPKLAPGSDSSFLARMVLNPRIRMPLPIGYADTHLHIRFLSIDPNTVDEGSPV